MYQVSVFTSNNCQEKGIVMGLVSESTTPFGAKMLYSIIQNLKDPLGPLSFACNMAQMFKYVYAKLEKTNTFVY